MTPACAMTRTIMGKQVLDGVPRMNVIIMTRTQAGKMLVYVCGQVWYTIVNI